MTHQTGTPLPDIAALKAQAKRLRSAMSERNTPMTQSMALEAVARQWGFRDWNTLSAKSQSNTLQGWFIGQAVTGRYLGHPITGTLKAVRSAQGGYWYLTVVFDKAVDVVESQAFSSFRKQVNICLNSDGITQSKLSDGTPHCVLHPA